MERLGIDTGTRHSRKEVAETPIHKIRNLLERHLSASTDPSIGSIRVNYVAANPDYARMILRLITARFIELTSRNDRENLANQTAYLRKSIVNQQAKASEVAMKRQKIFAAHPELADRSSFNSPFAARILDKEKAIEEIKTEIELANTMAKFYEDAIKLKTNGNSERSVDLSEKLAKEVGNLEFKILELTRIQGYDQTHPVTVKEKKRLAKLQELMRGLKGDGDPLVDSRRKLREIKGAVKELSIKRDLLQNQLKIQKSSLKEGLAVEFEIDSLNRKLNTHELIMKDLYGSLEKVNMELAGLVKSATIRMAPSTPAHAETLPFGKRVFFGSVTGLALMLSLLYLFDLQKPRIYSKDDYDSLEVDYFGSFGYDRNSLKRMSGQLMSLYLDRDKKNLVYLVVSSQDHFTELFVDLCQLLETKGVSSSIVNLVQSSSEVQSESTVYRGVKISRLYELDGTLEETMSAHQNGSHITLLLADGSILRNGRSRLINACDCVIHVASPGISTFAEIENVKEINQNKVNEYGLLVS